MDRIAVNPTIHFGKPFHDFLQDVTLSAKAIPRAKRDEIIGVASDARMSRFCAEKRCFDVVWPKC